VVAGEVKALAQQTAKATADISQQVTEIQSVAGEAASAVAAIGGRIHEIDGIAASIADAVEQQAAEETRMIARSIGSVTEASGETGHNAEQVLLASAELARNAEILSGGIATFATKAANL
jgi:methyl-accepting chemotaxis protein